MSSDNVLNLPYHELIELLNVITPELKLTKADLMHPEAAKMEAFYYKMMLEFGAADQFHLSRMENLSMLDSSHQSLRLLAALRKFFREINHPETIGLQDLYNPDPKRTKRFLSSMINAWKFCNSHTNLVIDYREGVDGICKEMSQLDGKVRAKQTKLDKLRSTKEKEEKQQGHYETLINEKNLEVQEKTGAMENVTAAKEEAKAELEQIRQALESSEKQTALEGKRETTLREVLHSEDVVQGLKQAKIVMKEEKEEKIREEHRIKEKLSSMEQNLKHLEKLVKQFEPMSLKHKKHQVKRSGLQQQKWDKPAATEAVDELSLTGESTRKKIAEFRQQCAVMEGKLAKIITHKKTELNLLKSEHVSMVKDQSDEEKQSLELIHNIQELQERLGDLDSQMGHVKDLLDNEEAKLIEAFNARMEKIFARAKNIRF